ncbi:MAG TPA: hypothetical protein DDZ40_08695 [Deltaproteobacteria bacterium]|nr:hypothetical protein [Deltaproteobacteria bacterium]
MSIEKIGNMGRDVGIHQKPAVQKPLQSMTMQNDTIVRGPKTDLTKISYPPFLPIGDTQSIYKR